MPSAKVKSEGRRKTPPSEGGKAVATKPSATKPAVKKKKRVARI